MVKYAVLGLIQGITEFLPVSSSGHLVIMERLLGIGENQLALSVLLHVGTLLALALFFFRDLIETLINRRLLLLLAVTTLITGAIGIAGKDFFERLFSRPGFVACGLIFTGALLLLARGFMNGRRQALGLKDAVILGLMQAVAVIPGISRSGICIVTLLFMGIRREEAFKLAFLAGLPVIAGAAFVEAKGISSSLRADAAGVLLGTLASFVFGLLSLLFLRFVIRRSRLHYFGYYCIAVAAATLIFVR